MGKRKRASDQNQTQPPISCPPPSDTMPCSSRMELLSEEKPLHAIDSDALKPLSSVLDLTDGSMKLRNAHPSMAQHHQSLGRSIFLKRSRHYYGHQYSRRNSANFTNASASRGKGTSHDDKLSFKMATQGNSDSGRLSECREKAFGRPERIRSSSLVMDAASLDLVKMVCGICQKPLRRKPYFLGSTLASTELSVVAVLVCGHIYHADCLEQKTSFEERRDPPCPLCMDSLSKVDD
ncbi:hypothetical protein FNV43_RR03499 [Rhamnella rubrinervis]|uniref:RING-type domain-containing protein n=1 Tax=Rhamnella rubrinervis TaxID=2594499 RepID=A0A8K0MNR7_9ROSA|nr:hypothetical protein FNV43_RR03499 [Rhamnella rubrinervis]